MDDKILRILLELKEGQSRIETRFDNLETRFYTLETKVDNLTKNMESVKEQTADLLEFRTQTETSLSKLSESVDFLLLKEHQAEKEIFGIKRKLEVIR